MIISNLKFENLTFGFGTSKLIFDNVSFDFPLNQTVWIKGHFGSGKSNFLRLIAGLVTPSSGKIIINNQSIHDLGFTRYSSILKDIGFGFDGVGLLVNQSLENNLALPLRYHKNWTDDQIKNWIIPLMEMLNVAHLKDEKPAFVSQSIYKAFLLLRAFVMAPEMMMINNPLTNLDEIHRESFLSMIDLFKREHGLKHLYIISDDEKLLERLNPVKLLIHDGEISYDNERLSA